jgi:hypothetical protein
MTHLHFNCVNFAAKFPLLIIRFYVNPHTWKLDIGV